MNMKTREARLRGFKHILTLPMILAGVCACEAPLNLAGVEAEGARELLRYDLFQAIAHRGQRVAVVSSAGAAVVSEDGGHTWRRDRLPGRPSLIDVTACENGDIVALDSMRNVWTLPDGEDDWASAAIDTPENTLSVHCAPGGRLWVSASFGTLYWRDPLAESWQEFSLYDDLQFTNVRFVDEQNGFAVGEFGTVVATADGGRTWEQRNPIPNEFYPMGSDFLDVQRGWVGGLDGVIWATSDGGASWERQETLTTSPVYGIHASGDRLIAVGGSAKLVEFDGERWQPLEGAPEVLAFLRGVDMLDDGSLLVAGGGGTLARIPTPQRN